MRLMNDFLEKKLKASNIKRYIPENSALANYQPYIFSNNFIFISGQLPITNEGIESPGKIKKNINIEEYENIMHITTSNLLWNLNDCIKKLKKRILKLHCCNIKGYFNCEEDFQEHSGLLNFTSNLIVEILGNEGRHSRVAIGVSSLPKNSSVEIEGIFSIL